MRITSKYFLIALSLLFSSEVLSKGQPTEWQISFQDAASPLMQSLIDLHDFVFWIVTIITIFVFFFCAMLSNQCFVLLWKGTVYYNRT